jgi:hypothetical protein
MSDELDGLVFIIMCNILFFFFFFSLSPTLKI